MEQAIKLCHLADREEILYGNVCLEIGERSMKLMDGSKAKIIYSEKRKVTNIIYGESAMKPGKDLEEVKDIIYGTSPIKPKL